MVDGDYWDDGFTTFAPDARTRAWVAAAYPMAVKVAADPALRAKWLRHDGTWFVGVDALPTGPQGAADGIACRGAWEEILTLPQDLHPAQLSVVYPGYPKRDKDETEAAHKFRLTKDAAHLDGLPAEGADRRRHLREPHRYMLGIALNRATASPLVVYPGSQEIIRDAFFAAFAGLPRAMWSEADVTEIYNEARAEALECCERVEVPLEAGEAILMHRMLIHGTAPWAKGAKAAPEGRMIAFFRPVFDDIRDWLRDED